MKKKLFLIFCFTAFLLFSPAAASEPAETFNLSTQLPASGTNWYFDADYYYDCEGDVGEHLTVACPANPRKDVPTLFVQDGANLRITGSSTVEQNIMVQVSGNVRITLDNASIVRTGHSVLKNSPKDGQPQYYITVSPMQLSDNAHLTLTLVGENTLAMDSTGGNNMRSRWSAGLGVPDGTDLIIEGDGKLTAVGGISAAGIGGHQGGVPGTHFGRPAGNITINGGTIIAPGRELASGIGSGSNLQGGTITINGGDITAAGGSTFTKNGANGGGAGIGGGGNTHAPWSKPSVIIINGGVVRATGGGGSAGIGSASGGINTITININGGEITATGGAAVLRSGAGIGSGETVENGTINIRGGVIYATSSDANWGGGAGIGGGTRADSNDNSGYINITGGTIFSRGGSNAAHIGNGAGMNQGTPLPPSIGANVRISPAVEISNEIPTQ
jgi:hypothetical protein